MKKLLLLGTLALMASNALAVTHVLIMDDDFYSDKNQAEGAVSAFSASALTTSTSIANPGVGLVVFADNGTAKLGLENEDIREEVIDEVQAIQVAIEEKTPLSDFQKMMLMTGVNAGQLDAYGNILK